MVEPYRGIFFIFDYPDYIVTKFLEFLGSILIGQTGDHINIVAEQLRSATRDAYKPRHRELAEKALGVIPAQASSS